MTQKAGHPSIMSFFLGGLAAGAIAITVSLLLRLFVGGIFIPELASQTLFSLTPGQVESQAVERFGPLAKYSAFIGAVAANLILYGLIGLLRWLIAEKKKRLPSKGYVGNALQSSLVAYIILLVIGVLLLALTETNVQAKLDSIKSLAIYLVPIYIALDSPSPLSMRE